MVSAVSGMASKGSHAEPWLPPQIAVKPTRSDGELLSKPPGSHSWRWELIWDHRFGHVTVAAPLWDINASLICAYVEGAFGAAGATRWHCRVWMSPSQWQAVSAGLSTSATGQNSEVRGLSCLSRHHLQRYSHYLHFEFCRASWPTTSHRDPQNISGRFMLTPLHPCEHRL